MAVSVTHSFVSPVADQGSATKVGPNRWNEEHVVTGLGTAAEADTTDFATAAQGALADTAVQPAAIANMLETDDIGVSVQAYDADLTSWAGVTRAAGFDTFAATPSSANLRALLSDEVGTGTAYFVGGALGTPASATLTNATGLPVSTGISGLATGIATFLATPSSANLRAALTDEVGTGAAYFVGGALGTPASGTATNLTGLPISTGVSGLGTGVATFLATPSSANLASALTDETGSGTVVFSSAIREKLAADRTYYVRTDGSDSNNGLANTSGGAFLTIQKAINTVAALDISIYNVTISVADGTYTGNNVVTGPWVGTGTVTVVGNTTTPANVVIDPASSYCFFANAGARLTVSGMEVCGSVGLQAQRGGSITVSSAMRFGATNAYQMYADFGGSITIASNYSIVGGAIAHIVIGPNSFVYGTSLTVTITGTPAFSAFFADVNGGGAVLTYFLNTFSGSATGPRYSVKNGGVINTNGGGTTYLPGNSAGTGTNFSASPWGLYI